jgi:hypothetical protein
MDPDIDGDGVPNEEDEYPFDRKRSEAEQLLDQELLIYILIGIVILSILLVGLAVYIKKQKKDK